MRATTAWTRPATGRWSPSATWRRRSSCRRRCPISENGVGDSARSVRRPGNARHPHGRGELGRRLGDRAAPVTPGQTFFTATHQYKDDNPTGHAARQLHDLGAGVRRRRRGERAGAIDDRGQQRGAVERAGGAAGDRSTKTTSRRSISRSTIQGRSIRTRLRSTGATARRSRVLRRRRRGAQFLDDAPVSRRQSDGDVVGRLHGERPRAGRRWRGLAPPRRRTSPSTTWRRQRASSCRRCAINENDVGDAERGRSTIRERSTRIRSRSIGATARRCRRFRSPAGADFSPRPTSISTTIRPARRPTTTRSSVRVLDDDGGVDCAAHDVDHRQQRGAVERADRAAGDDQRKRRRHAQSDVRRSGDAMTRTGSRSTGATARRSQTLTVPAERDTSRRRISISTTTPRGRRRTTTP